ncbi:hypothetical protein [Mycobacterium sp. 23]|uniref:hypothetical protein n=1 Tax=Mycobacterium sp. 23 TaxID=3400424 RepID=UPI003AAA9971
MAVAARQARKPRENVEQVRSLTAAGAEAAITARERAAAHAQQAIAGLWASVNPYNRDDVTAFAGQAARIMGTAQSAAARAAAVTQARQLTAMGVKASSAQQVPLDVRAQGAKLVRGRMVLQRPDTKVDYAGDRVTVDAESMTTSSVFERPAAVYRWLISQGEGDAAEQSMLRIRTLVDDNLMLAQRLAQQEVLARAAVDLDNQGGRGRRRPQIVGYRRVIHPELSRGGTCGMCIAASDRIYKIGTLMPIHAHCWCTIAAITEEHDPADDLNAVDLRALYKDAGGNTVAHLKRTRYQVDEHGELGPVLVPQKKYKPRTAQSKKRAGKNTGSELAGPESKADVAARHLPLLEKNLADLRARGLAEDSPQVTYHLQQIAKFKKELAQR